MGRVRVMGHRTFVWGPYHFDLGGSDVIRTAYRQDN